MVLGEFEDTVVPDSVPNGVGAAGKYQLTKNLAHHSINPNKQCILTYCRRCNW